MARGERTGRGMGMSTKRGHNRGVYGHKILWESGVRILCEDANKGWGESVLNCDLNPPLPPEHRLHWSTSAPETYSTPKKSKSSSVTWATGGGDAGVAPFPCQPLCPSCRLRSLVRAYATRVYTDAGRAIWLPLHGKFSKQRTPWCHRLH